MVVIVAAEFEQAQDVARKRRRVAQYVQRRSQLLGGKLGFMRHLHDDAHENLLAERNDNAPPYVAGVSVDSAIREEVEEGNVERYLKKYH
jgi:hypothetical protein